MRGLKFNMLTLEIIEENTGTDPLGLLGVIKDNNFSEMKKIVFDVFYAALLSNCRVKKQEPDFTRDQAQEWFNDLHPVYLYKIIQSFNSPQTEHSANGEVGKDTQPVVLS